MATRAEALKVRTGTTPSSPGQRPQIARAVCDWFRRGQLGASSVTEIGRRTGARI